MRAKWQVSFVVKVTCQLRKEACRVGAHVDSSPPFTVSVEGVKCAGGGRASRCRRRARKYVRVLVHGRVRTYTRVLLSIHIQSAIGGGAAPAQSLNRKTKKKKTHPSPFFLVGHM